MANLNVTVAAKKPIHKIPVYTEDAETIAFAKTLLKGKASCLDFIKATLSCANYMALLQSMTDILVVYLSLNLLVTYIKPSIRSVSFRRKWVYGVSPCAMWCKCLLSK